MSIKVGDVFTNAQGCKAVVIAWNNHKSVLIEYLDEFAHRREVEARFLRRGSFRNPYFRGVCGVGYLGVGRFKSQNSKGNTREYQAWSDMLKRCYSPAMHDKYPTYRGCSVADEWCDFQNFANWLSKHPSAYEDYQVDKDILFRGNKIYSPSNCCLVPHEINTMISTSGRTKEGFSQGVIARGSSFRACFSGKGVGRWCGTYPSYGEALSAYKKAKEAYVKEIANKWRGRIDERVYDALMNWTVN